MAVIGGSKALTMDPGVIVYAAFEGYCSWLLVFDNHI